MPIKPVKRTMRIRAAVQVSSGILGTKETSCYCSSCYRPEENDKFLNLSVSCGWEKCDLRTEPDKVQFVSPATDANGLVGPDTESGVVTPIHVPQIDVGITKMAELEVTIGQKMASTKSKKTRRKEPRSVMVEPVGDGDDCLFCHDLSVREGMIQCNNCDLWAHDGCADVSKNDVFYICDMCQ